MKIVVAGGTGFVGAPLVEKLLHRGDVVVLTRDPSRIKSGRGVAWNPPQQGAWSSDVAAADVVINLAGENIAGSRWTAERKQQLLRSRIDSTSALVEAMRAAPSPQRLFVSASAVGFYGARGDEMLDERASRGTGFLADLVEAWEAAAAGAESLRRLVVMRFGVVLDTGGGALARMLPPFRLGLGGPIGSGEQWMSWIDRQDVIRAVEFVIDHPEARGIYNVTAPEPVRNRDFSRALGSALHRPAFLPVPPFVLKMAFGQMAEEALLTGQRVLPRRLEQEGFKFESPGIAAALGRIL